MERAANPLGPAHVEGMNAFPQARVRAGVPQGGQFANVIHGEPSVGLDEHGTRQNSVVDAESVFTRRYASVEEKLAAVQCELEAAVAGLRDDAEWNRYLDVMQRFHRYSPSNQILIALQTGGRATRVAGFRKWQEMDRHVRRGEKGITILAPKTITETDVDENGKPIAGPDGKPRKHRVIIGFTTATVFDISQTEGADLPDADAMMRLTDTPPAGFRDDLEAAIAGAGYTVSYQDHAGGAHGYTDPATKRVVISRELTDADQTATLAHELAHIEAGHVDRVAEYHTGHNGRRDAMEIEAESIAHTLCAVNGMDTTRGSGRYIAHWGDTDPERVKRAAETVGKTVKSILGKGSWRNTTIGTAGS